MFQTVTSRGLVSIFGGFCIALVIGAIYLWGIISGYITSYFRIFDPSLTRDQVSLVFPFMFIGQATAMPIGVKVMKIFNARICCACTCIVMSIVFYASSFLTSFYSFALVYGMLGGFLIGFLYMVPVAHCYKYFPLKKGTVSGIIVAASGFGTLLLSFVATAIINPNNDKPNAAGDFSPEVANNVPVFVRTLAYLSFFFVGGGSLFLLDLLPGMDPYKEAHTHEHKDENKNELALLMDNQFQMHEEEDDDNYDTTFGKTYNQGEFMIQMSEYGYNPNAFGSFGVGTLNHNYVGLEQKHVPPQVKSKKHKFILEKAQDSHAAVNECPRVRDAPTVPVFWLLFVCMCLGSNFGLMISGNYKYYAYYSDSLRPEGVAPIYSDKLLSTIGAVGALMNGLSRFAWAFLLDKFEFKLLYSCLLILNSMLALSMSVAVSSANMYLAYVTLVYFCYGGHLGMFPALTAKIFGVRNGTQIYGLLFQAFASSNLIQYLFIKVLKPKLGGYTPLFFIEVLFSICALLVIRSVDLQYDWGEKMRENAERKRLAAS